MPTIVTVVLTALNTAKIMLLNSKIGVNVLPDHSVSFVVSEYPGNVTIKMHQKIVIIIA